MLVFNTQIKKGVSFQSAPVKVISVKRLTNE